MTLSRNLNSSTYFVLEHLGSAQLLVQAVNGVHQLPALFQDLAAVILQRFLGEALLQILLPGDLQDKGRSETGPPSNSIQILSPQGSI